MRELMKIAYASVKKDRGAEDLLAKRQSVYNQIRDAQANLADPARDTYRTIGGKRVRFPAPTQHQPYPSFKQEALRETTPLKGKAKFYQKTVGPAKRFMSTPGGKLKILAALGLLGGGAMLYNEGGKGITPEQALNEAYYQDQMGKHAFLDEGIGPLLWGAGGGVGGYLAGKHLLSPLLQRKEDKIRDYMLRGERALGGLQRARKIAPVGGGIIGALLLAALAAKFAKDKERERMEQYGNSQAYQHGFNPSDMYDVGDPYSRFYR